MQTNLPTPANDNEPATVRRIGDPFHRLYESGHLHPDYSTSARLYYVGERYEREHKKAAGASLQLAEHGRPRADCGAYEAAGECQVPARLAGQALAALGLRELVEDIIIRRKPIADTGRKYSGRKQEQQARCAAITALIIGLRALDNHYAAATVKTFRAA